MRAEYSTGDSVLCDDLHGRKPETEGIDVDLWLIFFVVQQKLRQHYKVIIPQLIKKTKIPLGRARKYSVLASWLFSPHLAGVSDWSPDGGARPGWRSTASRVWCGGISPAQSGPCLPPAAAPPPGTIRPTPSPALISSRCHLPLHSSLPLLCLVYPPAPGPPRHHP